MAVVVLAGVGLADGSATNSADYTVLPGDSLWSIATSHGLTVAQLASANRLDPNAILPIGKVLYLPGSGASSGSSAVAAPIGNAGGACEGEVVAGPIGELPGGLAGSSTYYQLEPLFAEWANRYGLPPALLEAVAWEESGWQQRAVSPTGAVGIGQIEPYTADFIEHNIVGQPLDINSISDNIRMSAAYLGFLSNLEGGNVCSMLAAYNEGPLALQTWGVLPSAQQYIEDVEYFQAEFE